MVDARHTGGLTMPAVHSLRRPAVTTWVAGRRLPPDLLMRGLSPWGWKDRPPIPSRSRSEEHTSELQSLMRISYAVFCLKKKKNIQTLHTVKNISQRVQSRTS